MVFSFNAGGIIADGKLYTYNTEHTPSWPRTRGWSLHCINATTGEGIWNITGSQSPGAIADGYLTAANGDDGYMYVYGKGKSATTVSAPQTAITLGDSVVITGTVLDQSPAQAGTACVSQGSMKTQMQYLHMQLPIGGLWGDDPMTGVPVSLDTLDPNGNCAHWRRHHRRLQRHIRLHMGARGYRPVPGDSHIHGRRLVRQLIRYNLRRRSSTSGNSNASAR